jgi:hypothetical protein
MSLNWIDLLFRYLVLHPAFKTTYFRNHKWSEEWIEEAVSLARAEWRAHYKPRETAASTATSATDEQVRTLYTLV